MEATYRVEIDGRRFDFAVTQGRLAGARGEPSVTITASAADLVTARLGAGEAKRKAALRRIDFDRRPGCRRRTASGVFAVSVRQHLVHRPLVVGVGAALAC